MTPAAYPRVFIHDDLRHRRRSAFDRSNADSSSRAGSPLLFGLAPRGVFRASGVSTGAVGSYPTFSPLPNDACMWSPGFSPAPLEDVSQVSLRDATVLHSAGGLFSVALSVAQPHRTGLNPMPHAEACNSAFRQTLRGKPPDVIRRVALSRVPLTIPRPPFGVRELFSVPQDGVRTFLPPSHLAMTKPAITRPARQLHYTPTFIFDACLAGAVKLLGGILQTRQPYGRLWRSCFWNRPISKEDVRQNGP